MSEPSRILVAGIGNIFLGDDAFGVEVVRRIASRAVPTGVTVVDFGIRGLDLAYALLEPWSAVILVDATPRGGKPGTLYVLEPAVEAAEHQLVEGHGLDPVRVLTLAAGLGATRKPIRLVGCEPGFLGSDDQLADGLSPAVAEAVEPAVAVIDRLVTELREVPDA